MKDGHPTNKPPTVPSSRELPRIHTYSWSTSRYTSAIPFHMDVGCELTIVAIRSHSMRCSDHSLAALPLLFAIAPTNSSLLIDSIYPHYILHHALTRTIHHLTLVDCDIISS
jgi:hypothetical protein